MTQKKFQDSPFQISREGKRPLQANNGPIAHDWNHVNPHNANRGTGIAREGGYAKGGVVNVHPGMHERQVAGMSVGGMGHATANDASSANPLAPEARGKEFAEVQAVPGQRSRTTDTLHSGAPGQNHRNGVGKSPDQILGRRILDEALAASAPDDRMAHGRPPFMDKG